MKDLGLRVFAYVRRAVREVRGLRFYLKSMNTRGESGKRAVGAVCDSADTSYGISRTFKDSRYTLVLGLCRVESRLEMQRFT